VIARSTPHLHALTRFGVPYDALFDGVDAQGRRTWIGASQKVDDFCSHVPGTKAPKIYAETFWGSPVEGIVVSLCVLDTGDGRAILRWRALTMRSRLAWRIKRRLDHRFVSLMRQA